MRKEVAQMRALEVPTLDSPNRRKNIILASGTISSEYTEQSQEKSTFNMFTQLACEYLNTAAINVMVLEEMQVSGLYC